MRYIWCTLGVSVRLLTALAWLVLVVIVLAVPAYAADYTRDGGTADEMCCADKACTQIISQHADRVRAEKACGKLTDADGLTRYVRSNAFRITPSAPVAPPPATGTATLSWAWTTGPVNDDGTPLIVTGYRILYGTSPATLQPLTTVGGSVMSHQVTNLAPGTWHFAVVTLGGARESARTNTATKLVP